MDHQAVASLPSGKNSCEAWTGQAWEVLPVSSVYPHGKTVLVRCYECHGPVVLMKASDNRRNRAHFEHRPAHPGCSLVYKHFSGTRTRHPQPVLSPAVSDQLAFVDYISDDAAEEIIGTVSETERKRLLLARVGQGAYRQALLRIWRKCSVIGCGPETALIASHIVSWRTCQSNEERLDPNNGLLLSPNLDKLFDRRLISFSNVGVLLVSTELDLQDAAALGVKSGMRLKQVPKGIVKYLARHRQGKTWSPPL